MDQRILLDSDISYTDYIPKLSDSIIQRGS
jgi:hypothetical protein